MAAKPVTVTFEIIGNIAAVCGDEKARFEARSKKDLDDRVVGHLVATHDWAKADAITYANSAQYTPATIAQPVQPTQLL